MLLVQYTAKLVIHSGTMRGKTCYTRSGEHRGKKQQDYGLILMHSETIIAEINSNATNQAGWSKDMKWTPKASSFNFKGTCE